MASLEEKEGSTYKFLAQELSQHLEYNTTTIKHIDDIQGLWDEADVSRPLLVGLNLLARDYDDLRSIYHLTLRGYGVSACAVAASVFEAAHSVGYIGQDDERAWHWLNQGKLGFKFPSVARRIPGSLLNAGIPDNELKKMTKWAKAQYEFLCMVKHPSNRNIQLRKHGGPEEPRLGAKYGPDLTRVGVYICAAALRLSANWARYTAGAVLQHPCDNPEAKPLAAEFRDHTLGISLGELELVRYSSAQPNDELG